ncbi:hypothetical protein BGW38_005483, partial [Lunasporangiospora selenospora]
MSASHPMERRAILLWDDVNPKIVIVAISVAVITVIVAASGGAIGRVQAKLGWLNNVYCPAGSTLGAE